MVFDFTYTNTASARKLVETVYTTEVECGLSRDRASPDVRSALQGHSVGARERDDR